MTTTRVVLTRSQILAFRRHVGALDARLPTGAALAPSGGVGRPAGQHAPRGAPVDPRARRGDASRDAWADPVARPGLGPAVQRLCRRRGGPRASSRSAGFPDDARGRRVRARTSPTRLETFLDGRRMPYGEAGERLGVPPEPRSATPHRPGRVLIRWDGARAADDLDGAAPGDRAAGRPARARAPVSPRVRTGDSRRRSRSGQASARRVAARRSRRSPAS